MSDGTRARRPRQRQGEAQLTSRPFHRIAELRTPCSSLERITLSEVLSLRSEERRSCVEASTGNEAFCMLVLYSGYVCFTPRRVGEGQASDSRRWSTLIWVSPGRVYYKVRCLVLGMAGTAEWILGGFCCARVLIPFGDQRFSLKA